MPNLPPVDCPFCGEPTPAALAHCNACGARLRAAKRGEAAGVRIAHERLDVLPHLEAAAHVARWGKASYPATDSDDSVPDEGETSWSARRAAPTAGIDSGRDASGGGATVVTAAPDAHQARAAEARPSTPPAAATVPPATTASRPSTAPPPLDAEVVVVVGEPEPVAVQLPLAAAPPQRHAPRPPVLASEALLRDLVPIDPAPTLLRFWSFALGAAGLAVVTLSIGQHGLGVPLSALFLGLLLLGAPPMAYAARARAVATVAASGLALVLWTESTGHATTPATLMLIVAVTVLATGLLLRSWHRASLVARILVMLGLCFASAHLAMNDTLRSFTVLDTAWQSWEPRLSSLVFGVLLMLASLAFMDSRTTAGCALWSACLLGYFAADSSLTLLRATWPKAAAGPDLARVSTDVALALLCAPLFAAALSIAMAQTLASLLGKAKSATSRAGGRLAQRPT